jgi:hypothetical protein
VLEGSLLARLLNPVYVERADGFRVKGWTDFAAGGVAVFEDRFDARNYFEYWTMEQRDSVTVLYTIRYHDDPTGKRLSLLELLNACCRRVAASTSKPGILERVRRRRKRGASVTPAAESLASLLDATQRMWELWNALQHLERRRDQMGRTWPETFKELEAWLALEPKTDPSGVGWTEETDLSTQFKAMLYNLAARRFPRPVTRK